MGAVSIAIISFVFRTPVAAQPQRVSSSEKVLQMDPLGTVFLLGGSICYFRALQLGGISKPWSDPEVLSLLVGTGALLLALILLERSLGDRALLQGRFLRRRAILVNCLYGSL